MKTSINKALILATCCVVLFAQFAEAGKKKNRNKNRHNKPKAACAAHLKFQSHPIAPGLAFFEQSYSHEFRLMAEEVTTQTLQEELQYLTGIVDIDEHGCLNERCSMEARIRTRQYLANRMERLGSQVEFEIPELGPQYPGVEPIDPANPTKEQLEEIWTGEETAYVIEILTRVHGWNADDSSQLMEVTESELREISRWQFPEEEETSGGLFGLLNSTSIKYPKYQKEEVDIEDFGITKESELSKIKSQVRSILVRLDAFRDLQRLEREAAKSRVEREVVNVIATFEGSEYPDEVLEVSAHYDTAGESVPGADDNGSGLATMLQLAELLKKYPPKRTVRLVFTDLEERGMVGSRLHSQNLKAKGEDILGVFVLDMFGYAPLHEDGSKPVFVLELGTETDYQGDKIQYAKARDMAIIFAHQFAEYEDRMVRLSVETDGALPGSTDLGAYLRSGHPGLLVSAPYEGNLITPGYHNSGDVIEQMNWLYFSEIAKVTIETVARISGMSAAEDIETPGEILVLLDELKADGPAALDTSILTGISNKKAKSRSGGIKW
ncbi:MAG: M28 family peptidase [Pseudomonadota bacterium]